MGDQHPRTDQYHTPEFEQLNKRRHELIDRKYTVGLSEEDTQELAAIDAAMDEFDRPFYDPILAGLSAQYGHHRGH